MYHEASYIEWLRDRIGQRKILLTFASILLRDEFGQVLMQRRGDFNAWGLPGGILELGENILTCARRELLEETGLSAADLSLVGVYSEPEYDSLYPNGDQVQQYTFCFQGFVDGGRLRADGIESRALQFFLPGEIPLQQVLPWYRAMLRDGLSEEAASEPAFSPPVSKSETFSQVKYMRRFIGEAPFIGARASAVIIREDGCLLVVRCDDCPESSFPAGWLDLGENAASAAQRIVFEETGLQVAPQRILGVFTPARALVYPVSGAVQPVTTVFLCRIIGDQQPVPASTLCEVEWMQPEQLLALPSQALLVELHQAIIGNLQAGSFIL